MDDDDELRALAAQLHQQEIAITRLTSSVESLSETVADLRRWLDRVLYGLVVVVGGAVLALVVDATHQLTP